MPYATNADLVDVQPSIINHGITDFTDQLTEAEADVNRHIEIEWFNKSFRQGFNAIGRAIGSEFDATLLTGSQWQRATIYRALYAHILPLLSPYAVGGDTFREMMDYYRNRFHEEMNAEIAKGVEYDANNDGSVSRSEVHKVAHGRIFR